MCLDNVTLRSNHEIDVFGEDSILDFLDSNEPLEEIPVRPQPFRKLWSCNRVS